MHRNISVYISIYWSLLSSIASFAIDVDLFSPDEPDSTLLLMVGDDCMKPVDDDALAPTRSMMPQECVDTLLTDMTATEIITSLPERILDWGSQGEGDEAWSFTDPKCNQYFIDFFQHITKVMPGVFLSPHDLFHAHMIAYGANPSARDRFAMVIHAKEYPADLEKTKNRYQSPSEVFTSKSRSFQDRNLLFVSHPGLTRLYTVRNEGMCSAYFSASGKNTLAEEKIAAAFMNGDNFGDVNMFKLDQLSRLRYRFYKGMDANHENFLDDLEAYDTGKTLRERLAANLRLEFWMLDQKTKGQENLLYFKTKR